MAGTNGRRDGGERVLESRHLVGLFLGVVLLCGVFFTLGYVMGKTQYGTVAVNAGAPPTPAPASARPQPLAPSPANAKDGAQGTDWDFYPQDKRPNHLDAPAAGSAKSAGPPNTITAPRRVDTSAATAPKSVPVAATTKEAARFQPPAMIKGSIVLQLAALKREGDALALADAVQQKHFPSFVVTSNADALFRVQVGPYIDLPAANLAKESLAQAGFNSIVKR
jgi:cell division septation protein DedD